MLGCPKGLEVFERGVCFDASGVDSNIGMLCSTTSEVECEGLFSEESCADCNMLTCFCKKKTNTLC